MFITDKHVDRGRLRIFKAIQSELKEFLRLDPLPGGRRPHVSLLRPGDTRWNSHYDAYEAITDLRIVLDEYYDREYRLYKQ